MKHFIILTQKMINNYSRQKSRSITLTLSWGGGEGAKKKLSPERRRKGGWRKKADAACLQGPGLELGTYRVLGEGPQLYATGVVKTSKPFRGYR